MMHLKLLDGSYSMSDIPNSIKYIIKKQETLPSYPPIHNYINRINDGVKINTSAQNKRWI